MRYLIVGNGVAGTTAAENIRNNDPGGEITLLTEEAHPLYSRIRLIDYLAGEAGESDVVMHGPDWHEEKNITLLRENLVASLDLGKREAVSSTGEVFAYDRLLIATGARSFVPPIPGAGLEGVFTLRTLDDARAIREYARGVSEILLIGGGVLGLEAGNSLRKTGKRVSVVEFFPRLLPRQTDPEGSRMLCSQMEGMGFSFRLGAKTKEIRGDGKVGHVLMEDGTVIPAEMVIISAGVRASTGLAKDAGIACGKAGIVVDDLMRTSAPDVFAAGDVTEHRGVSYGIWPAASEQGRVAGVNMAGGNESFAGMTPSNVLKVAGIDLAAAGDIDPDGRCQCIIKKDERRHLYIKLVHEQGSLTGCIILGTRKHRGEILKAVSEGLPPDALKEIIEEI